MKAIALIQKIFNLKARDSDAYLMRVDTMCNEWLAEHQCAVCGDYHDEGCVPPGCENGDGE